MKRLHQGADKLRAGSDVETSASCKSNGLLVVVVLRSDTDRISEARRGTQVQGGKASGWRDVLHSRVAKPHVSWLALWQMAASGG